MKKGYSHLIGNQHAKGNPPNRNSFKKGMIPWNKGLKGIHLSPATEFKKGRIAVHKMPLKSITVYNDTTGKKRRWIKVGEPNKWMEYPRFVWSEKNGVIPKGLIIHHINKNTLNDDIQNLQLVTRGEHVNLHRSDLNKQKRKEKKYDENSKEKNQS